MTSSRWSPGSAGPLLAILDAELNPVPEDLGWQDDALCAEVGAEMFFPEKGDPTMPPKSVCRRCGVAAECLAYALRMEAGSPQDRRHGIWGGETPARRYRLDVASRPAAGRQAA